MSKKRLIVSLLALIATLSLIWVEPLKAGLPPGNAVKDPYAILRNALPIDQKNLREIQHKLEDTSNAIRGSRWSSVSKAATASQFLLSKNKNAIIESIPNDRKVEAESLISSLRENLNELGEEANEKNKEKFIEKRRDCLKDVGAIEALLLKDKFPHDIPQEYKDLPRLLGRATVSIETTRGNMKAIIDGYNAPLTSGAFIDLALKGFYDGLPFNRAEDFYVLQTGDPKGEAIGYFDPETKEERHVPLEIRIPEQEKTLYNQTFEELGLFTETPVLPFATLGTLGWAHSDEALDDGSSQFFFFLYEAELNPAGRNLIDGRNASFGYVVEGQEILNEIGVKDKIVAIKVLDGAERLLSEA